MKEPEPWVNVEQVAQHLNVQKQSIYRWIEKKGFPVHRAGRLFRFKLSEVDEWMMRDAKTGKDGNKE